MGFYAKMPAPETACSQKTAYRHSSGINSGLRFYSTILSRWVNRDPIGEKGGINIYCFANNNGISNFDPRGRETFYFTTTGSSVEKKDKNDGNQILTITLSGGNLCSDKESGAIAISITIESKDEGDDSVSNQKPDIIGDAKWTTPDPANKKVVSTTVIINGGVCPLTGDGSHSLSIGGQGMFAIFDVTWTYACKDPGCCKTAKDFSGGVKFNKSINPEK